MLALRLQEGVDLTDFRMRYGYEFFDYFAAANSLVKQGFLAHTNDRVTIPDDKYYVANSILSELVDFDN